MSKSGVTCQHMQLKGDLSDIFLFYQAHCCGVLFIIRGCIQTAWKLTPWFISVDNTCTLLIIGCIPTTWKLTPWFISVDNTCTLLIIGCIPTTWKLTPWFISVDNTCTLLQAGVYEASVYPMKLLFKEWNEVWQSCLLLLPFFFRGGGGGGTGGLLHQHFSRSFFTAFKCHHMNINISQSSCSSVHSSRLREDSVVSVRTASVVSVNGSHIRMFSHHFNRRCSMMRHHLIFRLLQCSTHSPLSSTMRPWCLWWLEQPVTSKLPLSAACASQILMPQM